MENTQVQVIKNDGVVTIQEEQQEQYTQSTAQKQKVTLGDAMAMNLSQAKKVAAQMKVLSAQKKALQESAELLLTEWEEGRNINDPLDKAEQESYLAQQQELDL